MDAKKRHANTPPTHILLEGQEGELAEHHKPSGDLWCYENSWK